MIQMPCDENNLLRWGKNLNSISPSHFFSHLSAILNHKVKQTRKILNLLSTCSNNSYSWQLLGIDMMLPWVWLAQIKYLIPKFGFLLYLTTALHGETVFCSSINHCTCVSRGPPHHSWKATGVNDKRAGKESVRTQSYVNQEHQIS